jgi:hypothetical protein
VAQKALLKKMVANISCGRREKKLVEERERGAHGGYSMVSEEIGWWIRSSHSCSQLC